MTPDDLTAIRASLDHNGTAAMPAVIRALCDALEAAWAERDLWVQRSVDDNNAACDLEEEVAGLRRLMRPAGELTKRLSAAEAALARVRALCEQPDVALLNVNVIRAAIEGDQQ